MAQLTPLEQKEDKENKTIAGISTAVILSLLFILLMFIVFGGATLEDELDGGGGVAVSLGEPDAGGPSAEASAPQSKQTKTVQEQVDDPVISQDDDNAPVVKKTTTKKKKEEEKKVDDDLSDILGGLSNRKKTQGTGDGSKSGNEGRRDGSEGGTGDGGDGTGGSGDGTGDGKGSGVSYNLGGRKMTQAPPQSNDFYTNGKVTVKITVDRTGKVVAASIGRPSSNDVRLQNLAKQLAYKTRFQANPLAPAEQFGTMTITFKL